MGEATNLFEAVRAMMLENLERVQSATQSYIDTAEKATQGFPGANQEQIACLRHPAGDTEVVFSRREDPHCAGRPARRGEHLGAVSPRGHCRLDLLRLVEGVPGGRQAPVGGRHDPRRDVWRGERLSSRGADG
jgi:hypothetical protein